MSHPLDEVQNTPWGQQVTKDILALGVRVDRVGNRMSGLETSLQHNTEITRQIKDDTAWLRDMMNGTKAFGSLMLPVVLIVGGIVAIVAAISGWFHGKA